MLVVLDRREVLERQALFVVEVLDPVTQARLTKNIEVRLFDADGGRITARPVINHSGRFVWTRRRGATRPAKVAVIPKRLPFHEQDVLVNALPEPLDTEDRLIQVVLRPTVAYPFGEGVTAVRGRLWEGDDRIGVKDALIQLAWAQDGGADWSPAPAGAHHDLAAGEALTNEKGDFAVFLPLRLLKLDAGNNKGGSIKVRLQIRRHVDTMKALPNTWFADGPPPVDLERIPAGLLFPRDVNLEWQPE